MLDSPGASQQNTHPSQSQPWSQRGPLTRLTQGSQVEQYANSASTTTSGQKTSDKSNRSSGPYSVNTQHSNGVPAGGRDHPDFALMPEAQGGSQIPDTQEPSSQSQASSQPPAMPPPPRQGSIPLGALLNDPAPPRGSGSAPPPGSGSGTAPATQRLVLDLSTLEQFHKQLVQSSSGLSVEQLEQVQATMMEVVWRERGEWNRNHVLMLVVKAFNATVADIEKCQMVLGPSQPKS